MPPLYGYLLYTQQTIRNTSLHTVTEYLTLDSNIQHDENMKQHDENKKQHEKKHETTPRQNIKPSHTYQSHYISKN